MPVEAIVFFSALFALVVLANVDLFLERRKMTPKERVAFDEELRRDVSES